METSSKIRIVYVTTGTMENAQQMAKILVTEHLAACCSIIQNVTSVFGWQDSIHERNEYIIMIKTAVEKFDELQNRILQISKDEVPEIIAVPVTEIHYEYKNWLLGSLD